MMMLHSFSNKRNYSKPFFCIIQSILLISIFILNVSSFFPEFEKNIIIKCEVEFSEIDADSESVLVSKNKLRFNFKINDPLLSSTKKSFDKILSLKSKKFLVQNPRTLKTKILFKSFLTTHQNTDIYDFISLG